VRAEVSEQPVGLPVGSAPGLETDWAWRVGEGGDAVVGESVEDQVWFWDGEARTALRTPDGVTVFEGGDAFLFEVPDYELHHDIDVGSGAITAPMPGRIVSVHVKAGESVAKGARLVTLEAMKMEHGLTAPFDGVVAEAPVSEGAQVSEGALLVRLEAAG